jgi:hypothetical protein
VAFARLQEGGVALNRSVAPHPPLRFGRFVRIEDLLLLCALGSGAAACNRQIPEDVVVEEPPRGDSAEQASTEADEDRLIVPGVRMGPVVASLSEVGLQNLLRSDRVVRNDAYIGEGFCAPGSLLFRGTADSLQVTWSDSTFTVPAGASVSGRESRWRTPLGVHIGSTLKELEAIRGGPIEFGGFGWDYGGGARWTEDDRLDAPELILVLSPDSASGIRALEDSRYSEIAGDRIVRSDHPLVRGLTIVVEEMAVWWGTPEVQYECPGLQGSLTNVSPRRP